MGYEVDATHMADLNTNVEPLPKPFLLSRCVLMRPYGCDIVTGLTTTCPSCGKQRAIFRMVQVVGERGHISYDWGCVECRRVP